MGTILSAVLSQHVSKVVDAVKNEVSGSLGFLGPMLSGVKLSSVQPSQLMMAVSAMTKGAVSLDQEQARQLLDAAMAFDGSDNSDVLSFLRRKAVLMLGSAYETGEVKPVTSNIAMCPHCKVTFFKPDDATSVEEVFGDDTKTITCPSCKVTIFKELT